jgi:hypothetical protein
LYWNIRAQLGYLQATQNKLKTILQSQTGGLPTVTFTSHFKAQIESYAQQFKAQNFLF